MLLLLFGLFLLGFHATAGQKREIVPITDTQIFDELVGPDYNLTDQINKNLDSITDPGALEFYARFVEWTRIVIVMENDISTLNRPAIESLATVIPNLYKLFVDMMAKNAQHDLGAISRHVEAHFDDLQMELYGKHNDSEQQATENIKKMNNQDARRFYRKILFFWRKFNEMMEQWSSLSPAGKESIAKVMPMSFSVIREWDAS